MSCPGHPRRYHLNLQFKVSQCSSSPDKVFTHTDEECLCFGVVISRTLSAIVKKNLSIPAPPHLVLTPPTLPCASEGLTSLWTLPCGITTVQSSGSVSSLRLQQRDPSSLKPPESEVSRSTAAGRTLEMDTSRQLMFIATSSVMSALYVST